jgi:spermidine dehydrogenase
LSALTRRDFLNGVALSVGGALLSPRDALGLSLDDATGGPSSYPPALTGMRGSHDGSFEVAHALRDGSFWTSAGVPVDTGERYDLVVVGAGIIGLAAAWYFSKAVAPSARILVLDNHDDFGGRSGSTAGRCRASLRAGRSGASPSPTPTPRPTPTRTRRSITRTARSARCSLRA